MKRALPAAVEKDPLGSVPGYVDQSWWNEHDHWKFTKSMISSIY